MKIQVHISLASLLLVVKSSEDLKDMKFNSTIRFLANKFHLPLNKGDSETILEIPLRKFLEE